MPLDCETVTAVVQTVTVGWVDRKMFLWKCVLEYIETESKMEDKPQKMQ